MSVGAKICGVSTPEAVRAALDGGAAYVGFMFFEASPRNVSLEAARKLAEPVRNRVKVVAVAVDPSDAVVDALARELAPDLIQLHGKESPSRAREIAARSGAGVVKVLSVADASDLAPASDYEGVAEHLMFDTKPPKDIGRPGGSGHAFDWSLLTGRRFKKPWFLAGGLDPWNLKDAIRQSGAPLVDVSSGVERGPGLKDPALIAAFLDAARRA